jgi:hypothetical protein
MKITKTVKISPNFAIFIARHNTSWLDPIDNNLFLKVYLQNLWSLFSSFFSLLVIADKIINCISVEREFLVFHAEENIDALNQKIYPEQSNS